MDYASSSFVPNKNAEGRRGGIVVPGKSPGKRQDRSEFDLPIRRTERASAGRARFRDSDDL